MCFSGLLIKDICTVFPADMSRQYYLTLSKGDPYSTYGQKTGFWTPCTHYDHYVIVTTILYSSQPNICLKNWDKLHGGLWAKR